MEVEARLGQGSGAFPHSAWRAGLGQGHPWTPPSLDTALTPAPPLVVVLMWDGAGGDKAPAVLALSWDCPLRELGVSP